MMRYLWVRFYRLFIVARGLELVRHPLCRN